MVKKWRQFEVENEFKNSQSTPPLVINTSETLCHASTRYTHKIFQLFLHEYLEGASGSTSTEIDQCDNVSYHEVMLNHIPIKKYKVTLNSSTAMISCSCHKFDYMGILCSHVLRIYNIKGIMWNLLDIGVERVRQCASMPNLNSNEKVTENKFMHNEKSEYSEIRNPPPAKTKGRPNVRRKGHFEKQKRSTAKAKKTKGDIVTIFFLYILSWLYI